MKRVGFIFNKIVDIKNIENAIHNAAKGKGKRKSVQRILENPNKYANEIRNMLENKIYIPSPYVEMKIHDGANKKERIIYKPQFYPDQVIHWALMLQIEDLLLSKMYYYNCASIKNRGLTHGMKYIKKILKEDHKMTKYCLKIDVKKFYPSIDKTILKEKFNKIIKDKDTLWLINTIIDSSDAGVPIGNYTSQWFANFYLTSLDNFIKEELKVKYYIRYMDDMVLFYNNKKELHKIRCEIEKYLNNVLKLKMKENWQLFKTDSRPLDFLGYRFYRDHVTLRRGNFLRIKRRIKKIYKKGKISYKDACSVVSYNGWLSHCDSYNYIHKYVKPFISVEKCKKVISNYSKSKASEK